MNIYQRINKFLNTYTFLISLIIIVIIYIVVRRIRHRRSYTPANIDDEYIKPQLFRNLLTDKETAYIIENSQNLFKESNVMKNSPLDIDYSQRKSETAWLNHNKDPVINKIMKKICKKMNMPIENAESLQVVKYGPGGFFHPHNDSCCQDTPTCRYVNSNGGKRVGTMLIYLNDDFEGGETEFPNLKLKIKPQKNMGIFFRSLATNTDKCHPLALHGGLPVKSGTKYICNVWIHQNKYLNN